VKVVPLTGREPVEFDVINPSIWHGKEPPRREWMVEGLFLKGTVAMLSGDGGLGKSLIMQQLCSSAAIGRDWLGLDVVNGPALMVACEDDQDEMWRRQDRINMDLMSSMNEMGEGGLMLKPRVGQDNDLCMLNRQTWKIIPTPLYQRLFNFCTYEGVKFVVIDTATATFAGNQNDERQVTTFIALLRQLAVAIQGVVIITKHPSLTGRANGTGESGSVTWNNSVRTRVYLRRDGDGNVSLKTMKSNYGSVDGNIALRWSSGVFVKEEGGGKWY